MAHYNRQRELGRDFFKKNWRIDGERRKRHRGRAERSDALGAVAGCG